jgi:alpha-tubulin suppressor-like RCC1 family protein
MTDGTVQVSGNNDGDHGDGSQISTQSFAPISGMTNVSQIGFFYYGEEGEILKKDGSLWAAGNGNVGNGTTGPVVNYTKILDNVQKITNGAALKTDGTVWVWGEFHTDTAASYSPCLVPTLIDSNTTNIFAGGNSFAGTLFSVKSDGTVLGRGDNSSNLIYYSDSSYISLSNPVALAYGIISAAIGDDFNFLLFSNGTVWANGTWTYYDPTLSSTPNQFMTGVTSISIGTDVRLGHTALFTKQDGSVWGYGWNTKNSLLAGTTDTAIARPTRINF